jgi:hypothetical protein
MKRWTPANAIKHLSWPGKRKPLCWRCTRWTGARSAGLVVCGGELSRCVYRRASPRTLWARWWGLRNPPKETP